MNILTMICIGNNQEMYQANKLIECMNLMSRYKLQTLFLTFHFAKPLNIMPTNVIIFYLKLFSGALQCITLKQSEVTKNHIIFLIYMLLNDICF
jgi:hypothetical protein